MSDPVYPAAQRPDASGLPLPTVPHRPPAARGDRIAAAVFAATLLAGGVLLLSRLAAYRWFFCDEWEFLATRRIGSLADLLRHHGGHWVTLPAVAFRALWSVFRFEYAGYQAAVVALHLATVALLRLVMRRAGVGPWLATAAVLGLLLFGAGEDNIVWAFQITLVGALALGLVHLLLLDHDGPLDRRDAAGLAAGTLALMCSGIGLLMAMLAGGAALLRRGVRAALVHTVPLAALYAAWWLIERPEAAWPTVEQSPAARLLGLGQWIAIGLSGAFRAYGHLTGVGIALLLLLVAGAVLAWRNTAPADRVRRLAVPGALLAGTFVFLLMTGATRAVFGPAQAASSRYVYVVMALALPALAIAAQAVTARWRWSTLPVALLLVAGVPGNAQQFGTHFPWMAGYFQAQRRLISAVPRLPEAALVDPDVQPEPIFATGLTVGWLRAQLQAGHLPEPQPPIDATLAANIRVRLAFAHTPGDQPATCTPLETPAEVTLQRGDVLWFRDRPMTVELVENGEPVPGSAVVLNPDLGGVWTVQLDGLRLRLSPASPTATLRFGPVTDAPLRVCRP